MDTYSGNDFGAEEARTGYKADGGYTVLLPDGRKQVRTSSTFQSRKIHKADFCKIGTYKKVVVDLQPMLLETRRLSVRHRSNNLRTFLFSESSRKRLLFYFRQQERGKKRL